MPSRRSSSKEGACSSSSRGTEEASSGCTRSAHPSRRVSPVATLSSSELTRASSCWSMRWRALHAGAVRSSAGRWATLCAEEAPKSNRTPSAVASGSEVEGPRNISVVAKARVAASERGVPWSAARVHHAKVVPLASHATALGAGAADGVRLRGEIDGCGEEFGASEVLADHEDHVGGGDQDRAERLDLAKHGGPGGAGGMQADGGEAVEVRKHEGLAEDTNEEDGRHGLRGCSEVDELVRMRSKRRREGCRGPKGRRRLPTPGNQSQPKACKLPVASW